jgi:histidinol-phosphate aminotransferase
VSVRDLAPANVRGIAPYVPGKPISETARELGIAEGDILKMASNESPIGPSPKALAAIRSALDDLHYYPDGSGYELKKKLSARLGFAAREFRSRATAPTTSSSWWRAPSSRATIPRCIRSMRSWSIRSRSRRSARKRSRCRRAITATTSRRWPGPCGATRRSSSSPTRTIPRARSARGRSLRKLLEQVTGNVLVVIDEAYGEYLPDELASPSPRWLADFPNLVVARTLSKAYGLAGLRVGYAFANPDVAELMNRVRQPFNVNHLALVAASAALDDRDFIARAREVNAKGLAQVEQGFKRLGLEYIPSRANFVTVPRGRRSARLRGAPGRGRHRASHRGLRHAGALARHHRPAGAQRTFPRRPRARAREGLTCGV